MKTITFEAPAYWASYLINGDASGLGHVEKAKADKFISQQGKNVRAVCCSDEPYIGQFDGLTRDMLSYTAHV
jgi:hypothetical protein